MSNVTNHTLCGYIDATGVSSFSDNNAGFFNVIHPVLWTIVNDNAEVLPNPEHGISDLVNTIHDTVKNQHDTRTLIWPMVSGDFGDNKTGLYALNQILQDPSPPPNKLTTHINELVSKVLNDNRFDDVGGIAGIDIDYEGMAAASKDGFQKLFIGQDKSDKFPGLKNHPDTIGKQISVSLGAVTEEEASCPDYTNAWYYYPFFAENIDIVHIQVYDFHTCCKKDQQGLTHIGPQAPKGWVRSILENISNVGSSEMIKKFIYTLPNYGIAAGGVTGTPSDPTVPHSPELDGCVKGVQAQAPCTSLDGNGIQITLNQWAECCTGAINTTSPHMSNCSFDPNHKYTEPGLDPNCISDSTKCAFLKNTEYTVFFDTLDSLKERLCLATRVPPEGNTSLASLGGAGYWVVGNEISGFFQMIKDVFQNPQENCSR